MTLPNIITFARIGLVPWVLVALLRGQYWLAFVLFVVAGISDALDGILARLLNQRSRFGAQLDPLADKFMLVGAFAVLAWLGELPMWLVAIVIVRDFGLVLGAITLHVVGRPIEIVPLPVSKVTTLLQISLVAYTLFSMAFGSPSAELHRSLEWLTVAFTVISAMAYGRQTWRSLSAPAASRSHPVDRSGA